MCLENTILLMLGTQQHLGLYHYRIVRYHLKEQVGHRPQNAKELFNYRHLQLRSRIERAFGISKNQFRILDQRSFYTFSTQVDLILAYCMLHNFVREIDPDDILLQENVLSEEEVPTYDRLLHWVNNARHKYCD